MRTEGPASSPSLPPGVVAIGGTIRLVIFYAILPWVLSLLSPRNGWSSGLPSLPNLIGLVITGGGIFILLWSISLHVRSYSRPSPTDSFPPFLLVDGPYRYSRNPMYVADLSIWLGWAVFYGSIPVLLAALGFTAYLAYVRIPSEERHLQARFGEEYELYARSVPRWLGRRRTAP